MTDLTHYKAGILGWPVAQSRSPQIHNYWLQQYNIDAQYGRYGIDPVRDFKSELRKLMDAGWRGANVTAPHKEAAFAAADRLSQTAQQLGAVNILTFEGGEIIGDNSDGYGFIENLVAQSEIYDWSGTSINVLGAGGAARAIVAALDAAGVSEIHIYNRSRDRAEEIAKLSPKTRIGDWSDRSAALADCDLLVNTTSLGMVGKAPLEIDLTDMTGCVYDIVYAPLETPLLAQARARQLKSVDGLGMLLYQAVPAFEQWFGVRPEVDKTLRTQILSTL